MPFEIAVGGHASRTAPGCALYIDKYAQSEVDALGDSIDSARVLNDPNSETLYDALCLVPAGETVRIISSLQGDYSMETVPRVIEFLRGRGHSVELAIKTVPEEIRSRLGKVSIFMMAETRPSEAPTAFISYSWDGREHEAWVHELAKRLQSDDVNVRIDSWEVQPGDELPRFMEDAVRESDYVLVVCTPRYKRRADQRQGGVGYEAQIMTAEVMANDPGRKFISILREGEWDVYYQSWLLGKLFVDLRGESALGGQSYRTLLQSLIQGRKRSDEPTS